MTTWIANNTLPYLHGMTTTTAGLASYVLGALANFLLTPLAATTTMTSPVTELGIQMNMDPRILFYSFQYGLDNYLSLMNTPLSSTSSAPATCSSRIC